VKPIGDVLREHTKSLLGVPGVVAVAETLYRGNSAVLVMVSARTKEVLRQIPRTLEGYPVRIRVTGELRAL
jgi:hypothetical protein